jgi:S-formylglutathione hydrolase FrmB
LVAGVVTAGAAVPGAAALAGGGPARTAPACAGLLSDTAADGRLHHLVLQSRALARTTEVSVLLPAGYKAGARYPVLYLLHGAGDDDRAWSDAGHGDAEAITAGLRAIVVMPDAGKNADAGWYSDWVDGPRWEGFHTGELVPFVDCYYPTLPDRARRAVAGLSMGGFGALSYAGRHPDLFGFAATFSGAVDTADGGPGEAASFRLLHGSLGTPDDRVWGPYSDDEVIWRAHNPTDLVANLRATELVLRTGSGVPLPGDNPAEAFAEAGVHPMNVLLHAKLTQAGIGHEFVDGPGVHSWRYWRADLVATVPELARFFSRGRSSGGPARGHAAAFDYRSAEPSFSVYGWAASAGRGHVREFLDLAHVTRGGLFAQGSGTYTVTTPPLRAGTYTVRTTSNHHAGPQVQTARTAGDGRLTFTLDLGPAHTCQQYTTCGRLAEATGGPDYWTDARVTLTRSSG